MSERERSQPPEEVIQQTVNTEPATETGATVEPAQKKEEKTFKLSHAFVERRPEIYDAIDSLWRIIKTLPHSKNVAQEDKQHFAEQNVIFLDKSARPFATAFQELWRGMRPEEKIPNISFMNIGKEKMSDYTKEDDTLHIKWTPELTENVQQAQQEYTYLANAEPGSTILVIDDVEVTGTTRNKALEILQRAFPNLQFTYRALLHGDRPHLWGDGYGYLGVKEDDRNELTTKSSSDFNEEQRLQIKMYREKYKDKETYDAEIDKAFTTTIERVKDWDEHAWLDRYFDNEESFTALIEEFQQFFLKKIEKKEIANNFRQNNTWNWYDFNEDEKKMALLQGTRRMKSAIKFARYDMEKTSKEVKMKILEELQDLQKEARERKDFEYAISNQHRIPNVQIGDAFEKIPYQTEFVGKPLVYRWLSRSLHDELEVLFSDLRATRKINNYIYSFDYNRGEELDVRRRRVRTLRSDMKLMAREILKENEEI